MENKNIKYITFLNNDGTKGGFIFPEDIDHSEMAKRLNIEHDKLVGAGFCEIVKSILTEDENTIEFKCFGKSLSLNIGPDDNDGLMLTMLYLGFNYVVE